MIRDWKTILLELFQHNTGLTDLLGTTNKTDKRIYWHRPVVDLTDRIPCIVLEVENITIGSWNGETSMEDRIVLGVHIWKRGETYEIAKKIVEILDNSFYIYMYDFGSEILDPEGVNHRYMRIDIF